MDMSASLSMSSVTRASHRRIRKNFSNLENPANHARMLCPYVTPADREALANRAVHIIGARNRSSPLLLICEHAGKRIPPPWRNLGLAPAFFNTHFAYDLGAGLLTARLAKALDASAVLAAYSRLFLDLNRFPGDWNC